MDWIDKIAYSSLVKLMNSNYKLEDIYNVMFSFKDNTAVEYLQDDEIIKIKYQELKEMIEDFAYSFKAKYPEINDEYIGLGIDNSLEWIIAFWGIILSGNKPYLINFRHPNSITLDNLKTLNSKYTVSLKDYNLNTFIDFNSLKDKKPSDFAFKFANEIALGTSATTLENKICIYRGEELSKQILNAQQIIKNNKIIKTHYKKELKLLAFLPFCHIFGLSAVYLWFAFFGRTIVLLNDYSSETILKTIRAHKVTHIFAVPLFWETIAKEINKQVNKLDNKTQKKFNKGIKLSIKIQNIFKVNGYKIARRLLKQVTDNLFGDSVAFCITGGSYIKDSTLRLINALGYPLMNGYGLTEAGITSVILDYKYDLRVKNNIGKPFGSVKYEVINNELIIKGDSLAHQVIVNGEVQNIQTSFNTHDIAKEENGYYYILGRNSDVFIGENGENINPDLIEKDLVLPTNRDYVVLGYQNNLSLIINVSKYFNRENANIFVNLIDEFNKHVDISSAIRKVYFTFDDLKNPSAIKVSRKYVLKGIENNTIKLFNINEYYESKETELNQELYNQIVNLIAEVLGVEKDKINMNSHFIFDLGGTSLEYISLISMINNKFNIDLDINGENTPYRVAELVNLVGKTLC